MAMYKSTNKEVGIRENEAHRIPIVIDNPKRYAGASAFANFHRICAAKYTLQLLPKKLQAFFTNFASPLFSIKEEKTSDGICTYNMAHAGMFPSRH